MFESYFSQIGSNILSSSYNGMVSVSTKTDHSLTTFAFDNNLQNPRATAVFTEKVGIFGFSNDDYETAASYTYKTANDSGRLRPTISFLQKSDDSQSVKVHIPYTFNINEFHSFKIFASDEVSINGGNNDNESLTQTNSSQGQHILSLSGKFTHRLFNGKVTTEETMKILPQFFFATIINYSSTVLDAYLSKPIQQIKVQYAYEKILCFSQLIHINRPKDPYKYKIGLIVTGQHTMLGLCFTQEEVSNNITEEEEEEEAGENPNIQNTAAIQDECSNVDSFDMIDVFKIKIMHKQKSFKIASKLSINNSLQVVPKAGIEFKLNSSKIVLGANGKSKEAFFKYEVPFGKNNNHNCTFNASFDWIRKTSTKIGVSLQLNH